MPVLLWYTILLTCIWWMIYIIMHHMSNWCACAVEYNEMYMHKSVCLSICSSLSAMYMTVETLINKERKLQDTLTINFHLYTYKILNIRYINVTDIHKEFFTNLRRMCIYIIQFYFLWLKKKRKKTIKDSLQIKGS